MSCFLSGVRIAVANAFKKRVLTVASPVVIGEVGAAVVGDCTVRQVAVAVVCWGACDH